jgi:hypothetical protein
VTDGNVTEDYLSAFAAEGIDVIVVNSEGNVLRRASNRIDG